MAFADADGMALRIQMVSKGLRLSQAQFAAQFHIPLATLEDREQWRRQPQAAAWAYLQVIEGEPAAVRRSFGSPASGPSRQVLSRKPSATLGRVEKKMSSSRRMYSRSPVVNPRIIRSGVLLMAAT
jgi:hypothetical protein